MLVSLGEEIGGARESLRRGDRGRMDRQDIGIPGEPESEQEECEETGVYAEV